MAKITSIFSLLLLLCFACAAMGGEIGEIELDDGSVISGEVISFKNGVYKLKSDSLGDIEIDESKIREIRLKPDGSDPGRHESQSRSRHQGDIQALQRRMMSDQDIMTVLLSLQNDPDFQAILQDPEIIHAVTFGDINALISNPKFMKLLKDPRVQAIKREIGEP